MCPAGTPLWKLILKQFDDLLVKVRVVTCSVSLTAGLAAAPHAEDAAAAAAKAEMPALQAMTAACPTNRHELPVY
jgi:hypothetical protein